MKIHVTIVETKLLHGYCVPVDFCIIFGYFCDILKLYATYNFLTELGLYVSHVYLHVNLTYVSLYSSSYILSFISDISDTTTDSESILHSVHSERKTSLHIR